ncbi:hypothetical protein BDV29DRAFT_12423 [Aspergillus leporis]|uniref:Uncharacterized protein n=1 Tax=Aspergillus leporis TaxID=41062 RepID=A0A5N5WXE2_9EURO|nr:hypothetical protein BDV29DRAFT_12423 [Aspergillus leporis]
MTLILILYPRLLFQFQGGWSVSYLSLCAIRTVHIYYFLILLLVTILGGRAKTNNDFIQP